jgi:uncharacterized protein
MTAEYRDRVGFCRRMADEYILLAYEYVDDMVERRVPYREAHLERIRAEKDAGRITMGGALGDPPTGAAIVFHNVDRIAVEEFVAQDPYVKAGLVTSWRAEPWKVV